MNFTFEFYILLGLALINYLYVSINHRSFPSEHSMQSWYWSIRCARLWNSVSDL